MFAGRLYDAKQSTSWESRGRFCNLPKKMLEKSLLMKTLKKRSFIHHCGHWKNTPQFFTRLKKYDYFSFLFFITKSTYHPSDHSWLRDIARIDWRSKEKEEIYFCDHSFIYFKNRNCENPFRTVISTAIKLIKSCKFHSALFLGSFQKSTLRYVLCLNVDFWIAALFMNLNICFYIQTNYGLIEILPQFSNELQADILPLVPVFLAWLCFITYNKIFSQLSLINEEGKWLKH